MSQKTQREVPGQRRVSARPQPPHSPVYKVEAGDQNARSNEEEIASRTVDIQLKRFYVDVKQNHRGRFIKIAEMAGSGQKQRIMLSMPAALALADKMEDMQHFLEDHPGHEDDTADRELMKSTLNFESRRYYLDLKQNSRGRFLRIAQTIATFASSGTVRSQIVIPAEDDTNGLLRFYNTIRELVNDFGEDYLNTPKIPLPDPIKVRATGGKSFFLDSASNYRGAFLRISEVNAASGIRTSITIPASAIAKFRDHFNDLVPKFEAVMNATASSPNARGDDDDEQH